MERKEQSKQHCSSASIVVFPSEGARSGGVRLDASATLDETLLHIGERLGSPVVSLFSRQGALINDLAQLLDGEIYYISCTPEDKHSVEHVRRTPKKEAVTSPETFTRESQWITLNVGGRRFTTTRSTLTKEPESMLARMFASNTQSERGGASSQGAGSGGSTWQSTRDSKGAYLIDRSPTYFEPILNYLRTGELVIDPGVNPRGVLAEARFYGLHSLIDVLEARIHDDEPPTDATPLTRRVLVEKLIGTPPDWELRCQGVNFEDANLSKLDLRHVNFKYALLRRANLSGANLSFCNFERADLAGARLDGANLLGVKMLCVNLEGASMRGCNLEDPAGTRANMEGANMKHVDLEGSHMASVNLRVATLKNANLQNCDLRGAVLAGADLESCDLSGCDLQEANLRGANLKDAAFELMLNPVHMSQAVR